jgi:hypothetical protein
MKREKYEKITKIIARYQEPKKNIKVKITFTKS